MWFGEFLVAVFCAEPRETNNAEIAMTIPTRRMGTLLFHEGMFADVEAVKILRPAMSSVNVILRVLTTSL